MLFSVLQLLQNVQLKAHLTVAVITVVVVALLVLLAVAVVAVVGISVVVIVVIVVSEQTASLLLGLFQRLHQILAVKVKYYCLHIMYI